MKSAGFVHITIIYDAGQNLNSSVLDFHPTSHVCCGHVGHECFILAAVRFLEPIAIPNAQAGSWVRLPEIVEICFRCTDHCNHLEFGSTPSIVGRSSACSMVFHTRLETFA